MLAENRVHNIQSNKFQHAPKPRYTIGCCDESGASKNTARGVCSLVDTISHKKIGPWMHQASHVPGSQSIIDVLQKERPRTNSCLSKRRGIPHRVRYFFRVLSDRACIANSVTTSNRCEYHHIGDAAAAWSTMFFEQPPN
jgi:hypothetical protein